MIYAVSVGEAGDLDGVGARGCIGVRRLWERWRGSSADAGWCGRVVHGVEIECDWTRLCVYVNENWFIEKF